MTKRQITMVDQDDRAFPGEALARHNSLLLFQAAQRIRVRTPIPRKGSGGFKEGIPVTA